MPPSATARGRREPRKRRAPAEARQQIVEAAVRVFRHHHPDEVGLKEIAREAGVSHALITHYFGSYAGLLDAALESRVTALREHIAQRLSELGIERPGELISTLFEALEDPVHKRLWTWAVATERQAAQDFFALRQQGLRQIAEKLAGGVALAAGCDAAALQVEVERMLVITVAAAYGYSVGKQALVGSLGRAASRDFDRALQESLGRMIREHMLRCAMELAAQRGKERAGAEGKRKA
ncbi:MAG: TetR/AcrR family transcriptional regulator [Kofleriaceae bacterium]